jgi:hypothetical protein
MRQELPRVHALTHTTWSATWTLLPSHSRNCQWNAGETVSGEVIGMRSCTVSTKGTPGMRSSGRSTFPTAWNSEAPLRGSTRGSSARVWRVRLRTRRGNSPEWRAPTRSTRTPRDSRAPATAWLYRAMPVIGSSHSVASRATVSSTGGAP